MEFTLLYNSANSMQATEFCELTSGSWQNFLQKTVGPND